jgi:hypothetical protein
MHIHFLFMFFSGLRRLISLYYLIPSFFSFQVEAREMWGYYSFFGVPESNTYTDGEKQDVINM